MSEAVNAAATTEDFEFEALKEAANYRRCLVEEFSPFLKGHILEAGAGIGQMTQELLAVPGIDSVDALEPDTRFFDKLVAQGMNVRCHCGTLADLNLAPFDGIVSVNVLEHIEDHFAELQRFQQHLNPGGKLCLFVPAFQSIYAPMDRTFGHFRRYSKAQLRDLLEKAGFRIVRLDYYNSLGFFAWWFNFCVLKKAVFEVGKVRFYDRYLFPVVHSLEKNILRPPFGQSLLAIAEA